MYKFSSNVNTFTNLYISLSRLCNLDKLLKFDVQAKWLFTADTFQFLLFLSLVLA